MRLLDRGRLEAGQTLLVLGAAGGVGIAAVELGKAFGARVVAAVSSDEKAAAAMSAGADAALVYPRGPFDRDAQKALAAAVQGCGRARRRRRDLRPGRRRLQRGGAAQHRLGRAVPGGRFPGRDPEAAAQPHFAQELRRVRGVLGRVRGPRSRGATPSISGRCSGCGARAGSRRRSARPSRSSAAARRSRCSATGVRSARWW